MGKAKRVLGFLFLLFGVAAGLGESPPQQPALEQPLPHPRVIVFVHGLHGSRESWRASNGAYWPEMVRSDPRFAFSDVEVAEYPTPASNGRNSSVQLAEMLFSRLKQDHAWEHREVVFVAHSLGGILVEEMLLRHPDEAARVRFIVSYGTPHEGSSVARVASIYDKDPLLGELSDTSDNAFLTHLEEDWRGQASVNGIHRFCAYETEDTRPENRVGRYLKAHARVVSYFSATYGCDVTTPPQAIRADHFDIIRPLDRKSAAYDFFYRVYRDNPVLEEHFVTREAVVAGLEATCDQTNANADFLVPMALDSGLRERVVSAAASLVNAKDLRDVNPNPPMVMKVDADGTAHVRYGFRGPSRKLMVCLGTARASLKVEFSIRQMVPVREPGN
jgi:pimeloyl-ACP methyl ester carboxylesterase